MRQSEILKAIDKLMVDLASKALEYSECVRRDDLFEAKKKVRTEMKDIENQIAELREQLLVLTATTPTNGKK